jgi:hypothetical protein
VGAFLPPAADEVPKALSYREASLDQSTLMYDFDDMYWGFISDALNPAPSALHHLRNCLTVSRLDPRGELTWSSTKTPPRRNANAFSPFLMNTPAQIPQTAPKLSS